MGFVDKFKEIINVTDDDYYDGMGDEDLVNYSSDYDEQEQTAAPSVMRHNKASSSNKVVDIRTTASVKVVLVKPEHFDEASSIADHLNDKRTVVLILSLQIRMLHAVLLTF